MAYKTDKREKGIKGNIKGIPDLITKGKREYTFRYSLFPLSRYIPSTSELRKADIRPTDAINKREIKGNSLNYRIPAPVYAGTECLLLGTLPGRYAAGSIKTARFLAEFNTKRGSK